ncbi:low temperature requirement protein A [Nocardioides carbamazepini]|uniref:low temperature requirement protein A n=1 Tax=Nocardioides carbamazepini TaxID=2854259 RepID=UPI002149EE1D|nr:low temperature requirement protein A [Nocardioides carbamazepini]MCR1781168.1 low temperature requirement protein A [Nocardioides carbamazepini]
MSESTAPHVRHRTRRMLGRDPHEDHRAATPLELLFDLTFVVAFGTAASELAHALAEDHVGAGIAAFCFATFGISWAWINFTWFASAYDTDDWIYRLTTMLQMVGVLVFALGLRPMFTSVYDHGDTLNNDLMVWGYVVMRVAMVFQWWRAGRHDAARRPVCQTYIVSILAAQVLWCALALVDLPVGATFAAMAVPFLIEIGGPVYAERRRGGTPWHPHHVAERYGLMVIIALGEGMIGTMASISALAEGGLTWDVGLFALAGTALTFGIWWSYFVVPTGDILHARPERSFSFGYGHMGLFGSIVAIGAGLHVGAYYLEHHSKLGLVATVLTVAIPVALFTLLLFAGYGVLTRTFDTFHLVLLVVSAVAIAASVLMATADVDLVWCLLVLSLTPWVTVVGYETVGYRHNLKVLEDLHH